jgi:four helix bundle protein
MQMTNMEFAREMQARTKQFALRIIRLFQELSRTDAARILGKQALRSGTSVAAKYRAACRAKSRADFISKLGTAVEEADESLFWLELLEEAGIVPASKLQSLKEESDELLRILSTSLSTAKSGS